MFVVQYFVVVVGAPSSAAIACLFFFFSVKLSSRPDVFCCVLSPLTKKRRIPKRNVCVRHRQTRSWQYFNKLKIAKVWKFSWTSPFRDWTAVSKHKTIQRELKDLLRRENWVVSNEELWMEFPLITSRGATMVRQETSKMKNILISLIKVSVKKSDKVWLLAWKGKTFPTPPTVQWIMLQPRPRNFY